MYKRWMVRVGAGGTLLALIGTLAASALDAQTCGYCARNDDCVCNIPALSWSCGCCPGT